MRTVIHEIPGACTPEALAEQLIGEPGLVLLRSALFDSTSARYSFVAARPILTFRSFGSRCETEVFTDAAAHLRVQFGNPWGLLDSLMSRFELLEEVDLPFPLGGCFGYWGYDLKNFVEPKLPRRAINDLELPDCQVGFYGSLVVFDHRLSKTWIVSTGLAADGSRSRQRARDQAAFWRARLQTDPTQTITASLSLSTKENEILWRSGEYLEGRPIGPRPANGLPPRRRLTALPHLRSRRALGQPKRDGVREGGSDGAVFSNLTRAEFVARVERAQEYIRSGDIYQVNLSQRLVAPKSGPSWDLFQRLSAVSPAPFSAYIDCGQFQIVSSSPELFLRLNGPQIQTRPIKGTRPRSSDITRDAQFTYELQTSAKEMAELVMITDLLRNDLGKVCEFGSVQVPELVRLERYPQVQHLVSTVIGRLRPGITHFSAFASCFPGGSVTGAPKFRAMEIIDELEPTTRGPYTGALGYLGFNRESHLSISIRAAICVEHAAYFQVGAGIVADSVAAAEYEETLAKARGFFEALRLECRSEIAAESANFASGRE